MGFKKVISIFNGNIDTILKRYFNEIGLEYPPSSCKLQLLNVMRLKRQTSFLMQSLLPIQYDEKIISFREPPHCLNVVQFVVYCKQELFSCTQIGRLTQLVSNGILQIIFQIRRYLQRNSFRVLFVELTKNCNRAIFLFVCWQKRELSKT